MARVNVSDAVWVKFRSRCLERGVHVADALAELVEQDVAEAQARSGRGRRAAGVSAPPTLFEPEPSP